MQDDDENDDPMILNNRAKNHTSERTIVPWTVIFMQDVPRMFPGPSLAGTGDGMSGNLRMNHISLWTPAWALKSGGTTRERPTPVLNHTSLWTLAWALPCNGTLR